MTPNDLTMRPGDIGDLEPHRPELTGFCRQIVGTAEADDAVEAGQA